MLTTIQNLITAHRADYTQRTREKKLPQVKVNQTIGALAVLYEKIRNAVDYEEEHLLRKRALKRIMLRVKMLEAGSAVKHGETLMQEILWARYMGSNGLPEEKLKYVARVLRKYQFLLSSFQQQYNRYPEKELLDDLYAYAATEIERLLVPIRAQDALIDAQFQFLRDKDLLKFTDLEAQEAAIQLFIACNRANIKADDEMIGYRIFNLMNPNWIKITREEVAALAPDLEQKLTQIADYLNYKLGKNIFREITRQSLAFQILDKAIVKHLDDAERIVSHENDLEKAVRAICNVEYAQNRRKLTNTIIRSIIYIFVTKILLAFVIEIPYELLTFGHINWTTLAINIIFPALTLFIIANNFAIPSEQNTLQIIDMIKGLLFPEFYKFKTLYSLKNRASSPFKFAFRLFYGILFLAVIGGIIILLNKIGFNVAGIFIFLIFFSTICFVAVKLRDTASELKVVETKLGFLSPLVDMISAPILLLGKRLSEGASELNFFTVILDFLVEAPFKRIIKVFEEWSNYIRETREEIV